MVECFLAYLNSEVYIIPVELRDEFYDTPSYKRYDVFRTYYFPEDSIIDTVLIEQSDMNALVDGDFE